ncbi:MAG: hypothetical protein R3253_02255 [Longimicrobiales bacterium]|nr:hypothetical protein [Longimicrobiales bacterium]
MKLIALRKSEQNQALVDPWTVVHFAAGLACGLVEIPLRTVLPLAAAYELAEQELEASDVGQELLETSGPESVGNAIVDVAVFALGHQLGRRWNRTK